MKKNLLLISTALLPFLTNAQVAINDIWYNLDEGAYQAEVTYKGDYASQYKEYHGSIIIPAIVIYEGVEYSVTSIGDQAFYDCEELIAITIPESVTCIGSWAFHNCSNLTAITIPEGVTSIKEGTFDSCCRLSNITFPKNPLLTSIGYCAFYECSSLTSITLPSSITNIENCAFLFCCGLIDITIPKNSQLTSIGSSALAYCSSLTNITIPKGVTNIGSNTFRECSSLRDVYCYAETVPSTDSNAFGMSDLEHLTLHVPSCTLEDYQTTAPWSRFGEIVHLTDEEMSVEQSIIKGQHEIYDLQGHRVTHPTKGVYIVNGHKMLIK